MICYRDMTFCRHYTDCKHRQGCPRPLTLEVKSTARAWWGGDDPPIAVFTEKPGCHSDNDGKQAAKGGAS